MTHKIHNFGPEIYDLKTKITSHKKNVKMTYEHQKNYLKMTKKIPEITL